MRDDGSTPHEFPCCMYDGYHDVSVAFDLITRYTLVPNEIKRFKKACYLLEIDVRQ